MDWLRGALMLAAEVGGSPREVKRLQWMAMEVSARQGKPAESCVAPVDSLQEVLASISEECGRQVDIKCALKVLRDGGHEPLAKRLQGLSKARNVCAHPDVRLQSDICQALSRGSSEPETEETARPEGAATASLEVEGAELREGGPTVEEAGEGGGGAGASPTLASPPFPAAPGGCLGPRHLLHW